MAYKSEKLKLVCFAIAIIGVGANPQFAQARSQNGGDARRPAGTGAMDLGQTSETGNGRVGARQLPENFTKTHRPLKRLQSRINNRIENRINNRIDKDYDPRGGHLLTLQPPLLNAAIVREQR